jgi:gluconolactonase
MKPSALIFIPVTRKHRAILLTTVISCFLMAAGMIQAQSSIIAPNAELELLADGFKFTEGPASDSDGNVYFTDQPNDRILSWSVDGKLSTFLQPSGRANGLSFDL